MAGELASVIVADVRGDKQVPRPHRPPNHLHEGGVKPKIENRRTSWSRGHVGGVQIGGVQATYHRGCLCREALLTIPPQHGTDGCGDDAPSAQPPRRGSQKEGLDHGVPPVIGTISPLITRFLGDTR